MPKTFAFEMDDTTYALTADALAHNYGYSATVSNPGFDPAKPASDANPQTIPNPQSIDEFGAYQVQRFIGENIRSRQVNKAAEEARAAALAAVNEGLAKADTKVVIS